MIPKNYYSSSIHFTFWYQRIVTVSVFIWFFDTKELLQTQYSFDFLIPKNCYSLSIYLIFWYQRIAADSVFIWFFDTKELLQTQYLFDFLIPKNCCRLSIYLIFWYQRIVTVSVFIWFFDLQQDQRAPLLSPSIRIHSQFPKTRLEQYVPLHKRYFTQLNGTSLISLINLILNN